MKLSISEQDTRDYPLYRIQYMQKLGGFPAATLYLSDLPDEFRQQLAVSFVKRTPLILTIGNTRFLVILRGLKDDNQIVVSFEDKDYLSWTYEKCNEWQIKQYSESESSLSAVFSDLFGGRLVQEETIAGLLEDAIPPYAVLVRPANWSNKRIFDQLLATLQKKTPDIIGWSGLYNPQANNSLRILSLNSDQSTVTMSTEEWGAVSTKENKIGLRKNYGELSSEEMGSIILAGASNKSNENNVSSEGQILNQLLLGIPGRVELVNSIVPYHIGEKIELQLTRSVNPNSAKDAVAVNANITFSLEESITSIDHSVTAIKPAVFLQWLEEPPHYAKVLLHDNEILVQVLTPGYVRDQEIGYYAKFTEGDEINVLVSQGEMPYSVGASQKFSSEIEEENGLYFSTIENLQMVGGEIKSDAEKTSCTGELNVESDCTFNATLELSGDATLGANVKVSGNMDVSS